MEGGELDIETEEGGVVNVNGTGRFNLSSDEGTIIPRLNIEGRSRFNLGRGRVLQVVENLNIGEEAELNTGSGDVDMILAGNYIQKGRLSVDISVEEGRECPVCDRIIGAERVELGRRSKLKIEENGDCRGQRYMLIKYRRLEGRFGEVEIPREHEIEYGYEGKWIALIPKEKRRLMEARVEEME
jgi:hypothetical protein